MTIQSWPLQDRPREKLVQQGALHLSDAELLAIILGSGTRGVSALALAQAMYQHFGGLRAVFEAGPAAFSEVKGVGVAKFTQLQACAELGRRYLAAGLQRGEHVLSTTQAVNFFRAKLRHYRNEVLACVFLDAQHRVINDQVIAEGALQQAELRPRELVRLALEQNAASVILAHNHPSGVAEPSQADCLATQQLRSALKLVDIELLDHFVVGDVDVRAI